MPSKILAARPQVANIPKDFVRGVILLAVTQRCLIVFVMVSLFLNLETHALEDISLLPKGVRALMYRQGVISEIGNKYSSNYQLGSIQYRMSRRIDAKMIQQINEEFVELVKIMNNEFPDYNLGDKVYLGDLILDGDPRIDFKAPILAYGVTNSYTLAVAVPIVDFQAKISARHTGQYNIEQIKAAMPSTYSSYRGDSYNFSARLEDAYRQLQDSANLTAKVSELCRDKNLKCLGEERESSIGDIQLVNRFLLYEDPKWAFMYRAHINLPTGPEDDPNNLLDLPVFHRTFIDHAFVSRYTYKDFKFHNALAYVMQVPDRVNKRVPESENDILPDEDRTENLQRKIGDSLKYEFNSFYQINPDLSLGAGFTKEWKSKDSYRGSYEDRNYSLLSRNTSVESLKFQGTLSYSTVDRFLRKKFPIPLSLSYSYSDLVSGKNVERQLTHELNLAVMF